MGLLEDRVVLVNGGSQGVGAGVARAAVGEGATVVFTGRRADVGEKLAADTGARFVRADLSDPAQARDSVVQAVEAYGRVDCLVNAAGLTSRGSLLDTTPELFDQHMAINLKAPGTIVNIGSNCAHGGPPCLAPYSTAKAGLAGLTRNAAHAHRFDRIRINTVNIGWTDAEGEDVVQRAQNVFGGQD